MALNKFMHPRNIYKNPPDFRLLAKNYDEFSNVVKTDVSGKVSIDFKDPHALRVLTKCLLKSDFNLDVKIPEDRLVPTLPLRLNYIHWIEDLLNLIDPSCSIRGIDIGTGACAIYPLLAAVRNQWHMIGTETDDESFNNAIENVHNNNLQNLIELRKNSTKSTIEYLFTEEESRIFHFTMCNPPFYTNIQELWESRSPARPQPKNAFTGSPQELITEGGELQFCRQMIEESKNLQNNILIFTTMVGHKYNLKELIIDLKADGIKYTTTEFCQGRITRWGLAWTFQNYDFTKIEASKDKMRKKTIPITFHLPRIKDIDHNFDNIFTKAKQILENLKVTYKIVSKRNNEVVLDMVALSNTWSNQRRKRRLMKRTSEPDAKKGKKDMADDTTVEEKPVTTNTVYSVSNSNTNNKKNDDDKSDETNLIHQEASKEKNGLDVCEPTKLGNELPLVHAVLKIQLKNENILFDMEYLNGSAGKEGLHQIVQYIKNNWK